MCPDIISLGEPLLEFNATSEGSLVSVENYEVGFGGDTSNFAIAVSRLGGSAGYICRIGDDDFGRIFLNLWGEEGVDTGEVIVEEGGTTGIYFIARQDNTHSFTYYRRNSAASKLSIKDIPEEYIRGAKIFHTTGISQAISNTACDAVFRAIEIARSEDVLVAYDPNIRFQLWGKHRARSVMWETIRMADIVFPNLEEGAELTNLSDPISITKKILERGPKVVVLKMGSRGALLASNEGFYFIDPLDVDVVDATGAGDTFAAAFLSKYIEVGEYKKCLKFAGAAAALTSTGCGAVRPIPRKSEVEEACRRQTIREWDKDNL